MATYNNIKKIKIGDNTFNLYDSGNSGGTITSVKTTAGTHTAIDVSSGAVSFNVPTKTSHLTNDSGFITASHTSTYSLPLAASGTRGGVKIGYSESGTNYAVKLSSEKMYVTVPWTDTKVTTAALISGTTYYPILATGTGTATRQIDSTFGGLKYVSTAGTTSTIGTAMLQLGNATTYNTANNEEGVLRLYSSYNGYIDIKASISIDSNTTIYLPSYASTMYLAGTNTGQAVGSSSVPVYVNGFQTIQAVDSIAIGLIEKPFMRVTGSTTNVNLSSGVITQIPLYTVEFQSEYSGISLDTTKHTILLEPGYYRVSGSIYFASGTNYSVTNGVYIRMGSTDVAFASAKEVAAAYIYGSYSINASTIVKVIDNCYLWLGARSSTTATVDSDNTATFLAVDKIGSIY